VLEKIRSLLLRLKFVYLCRQNAAIARIFHSCNLIIKLKFKQMI